MLLLVRWQFYAFLVWCVLYVKKCGRREIHIVFVVVVKNKRERKIKRFLCFAVETDVII